MKLRIAAVQYHFRPINHFDQFKAQVSHYVETAAEYGAQMVLFPEFLTTQLATIRDENHPEGIPIRELASFTEAYEELFRTLAARHRQYIVGGTHIIRQGEKWYNSAHFFYPDGRIERQAKLHLTPVEKEPWRLSPGENLNLFDTPWGKVALLICYDVEFPELARLARARGATLILCPSCTDDQHGFYRVRYSAHARAVENQVYVVTTGTTGMMPLPFMRTHYGQAAFITPNDLGFPPKGILMEGELNQDMVVAADLDLALLDQVRQGGAVAPWTDRRTDLYPDWK